MSRDHRTPQAKKWADEYIPPETCAAIDDVQNALEHLRDTNSQLRHAAYFWKHVADDEKRRRRALGETVTYGRERFAEILRIIKIHDAPLNLLAAIERCAQDGLSACGAQAEQGQEASEPSTGRRGNTPHPQQSRESEGR